MIETAFLVIFDFVYLFIATRPKNMNKSISRSCKRTLKMLKKDGKLPYSQHYTVDFLDDEYIETTENSVSHIKYGDVNKVIYSDDALYLFIDAQRATAILYSCLGEDKQKIIDFIKQKQKVKLNKNNKALLVEHSTGRVNFMCMFSCFRRR